MSAPRTPVVVKLVGEDGNAFAIIARVRRALRRAGYQAESEEFTREATSSHSYDEVLRVVLRYVEVE